VIALKFYGGLVCFDVGGPRPEESAGSWVGGEAEVGAHINIFFTPSGRRERWNRPSAFCRVSKCYDAMYGATPTIIYKGGNRPAGFDPAGTH
jgi:hypothetical protein